MISFYVLTIFPKIIECYTQFGIVRQAIKKGHVEVKSLDLREFAHKRQVDDAAYGGVPGMVLKPEPILKALEYVSQEGKPFVVLTEPWGRRLNQELIRELSQRRRIAIICGRYEGVDERVKSEVDMEISLGDFVLSGGELVALSLIDGISRLVPGVLSEPKSVEEDSFQNRWLGYPVYTRPRTYRGMSVPPELTSGNHRLIELWTMWHRIKNTYERRPDLVPQELTPLEESVLRALKVGMEFNEWLKGEGRRFLKSPPA